MKLSNCKYYRLTGVPDIRLVSVVRDGEAVLLFCLLGRLFKMLLKSQVWKQLGQGKSY